MPVKAYVTNQLATSPHYQAILSEYNDLMKRDGRVNNKKFHREVIAPRVPNYSYQSWYKFLERFRTSTGLAVAIVSRAIPGQFPPGSAPIFGPEEELEQQMMGNQLATTVGLARMLNIGADALREVLADPSKLAVKDRVELLLKAMKAQDSRMHALGKVREDSREQAKFDRAFRDAASGV